MTEPSPIGRVRAVIYARGGDAREEDRAVAACERWASCHDWEIAAVVREASDTETPLERLGMRTVLNLMDGGRATVLLVSAWLQLGDDDAEVRRVCAAAERAGGFVHVLHDALTPPPAESRATHLEMLARSVRACTSLRADLVRPSRSGPVFLHVHNPEAADLSEDIACDLLNGEWTYVWSWGETLGPVGEPDAAAKALGHVLASQGLGM